MKKSLIKLSIIILMTILLITAFINVNYAGSKVTDLFKGEVTGNETKTLDTTRSILGIVLNSVRNIGLAVAIIILTVIGIKFMIASPSERANIKQYSMNYVIGAFFLIGAAGIIKIVQEVAKEIKVE